MWYFVVAITTLQLEIANNAEWNNENGGDDNNNTLKQNEHVSISIEFYSSFPTLQRTYWGRDNMAAILQTTLSI